MWPPRMPRGEPSTASHRGTVSSSDDAARVRPSGLKATLVRRGGHIGFGSVVDSRFEEFNLDQGGKQVVDLGRPVG